MIIDAGLVSPKSEQELFQTVSEKRRHFSRPQKVAKLAAEETPKQDSATDFFLLRPREESTGSALAVRGGVDEVE